MSNSSFTRKYSTLVQTVLDAKRANQQDSHTRIINCFATPTAAGNYQFFHPSGDAVVLSNRDIILMAAFKGNSLSGANTFSIGTALTATGAPVNPMITVLGGVGDTVAHMITGGVIGVAPITTTGGLMTNIYTGLTNRFLNVTTTGTNAAGNIEGVLLVHTFSSASLV